MVLRQAQDERAVAISNFSLMRHGSLELALADRGGRTRLAQVRSRPPLQVQQTLYPDPALPHLALVMVANPTGGIFQGDRHSIAVRVESGAAAHVTGQGATRIHAMPQGRARQEVALMVAEGGYLEYLPDPLIPYRDSDFEQRTTLSVAAGGALVYWDIITPGRVAMGESFRYRRLVSRLEVLDCGGRPAYREAFRLEPSRTPILVFPRRGGSDLKEPSPPSQLSPVLRQAQDERGEGTYDGHTLGSMLIIADGQDMGALLAELQELLRVHPHPSLPPSRGKGLNAGAVGGATLLPNQAGVGVRVVGVEATEVRDALTRCWVAARQHLLGCAVPFLRKY